jgi:hypothetical protein
MSEDEKQVRRYVTAIADAIFESAPQADFNNSGMRPVLVMQHVLMALVSVQACVLARTDSLSATPKALRGSVGDYAKLLSSYTRDLQRHPESNPFAGASMDVDLLPHAAGTPQ